MPKAKELSRDEMTPFAAALQDWMWDQRPSWPRSKVATALGVARGTVDSWFRSIHGASQPTLPTGAAVRALMRVTGWSEAQMKALTGYRELPPVGLYEFILDEVDKWLPDRALGRDGFDDIERAKVHEFLTYAHQKYATLGNKRPPRRDKAPSIRQEATVYPYSLILDRPVQDDITDDEAVELTRQLEIREETEVARLRARPSRHKDANGK